MLRKCPQCQRLLPDGDAREPEGTRLESVESIRRLVEQAGPAAHPTPAPPKPQPEVTDDGIPLFHPRQRPPLALLCIVDDGPEGGEWIRIRVPEVTIGRAEGQILIPHDEAISGRHCAIVRVATQGRWEWRLRDLGSSNGTFARAAGAILRPQQEILVGACRFRYELPADAPPTDAEPVEAPARNVTRAWQVPSFQGLAKGVPALVELTARGEGERHPLAGPEHWIGSSPEQCDIVVRNDPFVSKRHAQLSCDHQGRWQIRDAKSRNGTWLRIQEITVKSLAEFQAGEQRFLLRIPSRDD
ncbi:MAG: FHA domain-containing protein [Pirellulales bacterium]|nr:FHA domain-containing protein [Pirellulales bacterium]